MKKKVFLFSVLVMILILPLVFAESNDTDLSESQKVSKAKDCLRDKIEEKGCDNLGFEEKLFSVLSVGKCKKEFLDEGKNEECWPDSECTLKGTAQALIALAHTGEDSDKAEEWLLDQRITPSEIVWYLQIESSKETKCAISYSGKYYDVVINEEKQISAGAGNCLTLSEGGWWLRIAPSCYGEEFEISCDQNFLTNLLFKHQLSSTIHVSEKTTASSANGKNIEKVESFCFGKNQVCNYEGSLWASIALDYTGNEIEAYLPYLITLSENTENSKFIPESFLYYTTNSDDFRNSLLLKQKISKYWDESGDKFYDTAVALLPVQDDPQEKINSKNWLLDDKTRDSDGCWKGSIATTGFILYSIWPSAYGGGGGIEQTSCTTSSGYCLSPIACVEAGGIELNYVCDGMAICCNKDKAVGSCFDQSGEVCSSDEICQAGVEVYASDLSVGETCCVRGICTAPKVDSECVAAGGYCKTECSSQEEPISYSCDYYSDFCCVEKTKAGSKLWIWIWIFIIGILIILGILAYIYRDKLKAYWASLKKRKSSPPSRGGSSFPRSPPPFPPRGIVPRRVVPPSSMPSRTMARPIPKKKPEGEMEDVLRKLKEMGK